jgi:gamma-glutamyltranspeptidase / glutathione hydrolase
LQKISKYPSSVRALLKNGKPFDPGDLFVQADLGRTLQIIATEGAEAFYKGDIARRVAAYYAEQNGLIRYEDLAGLEAS